MVKVREHRGSLNESMQTAFEVSSRAELTSAVQKSLGRFMITPITEDDIVVEPYGYDSRINWNTHIISVKGRGVYGFSNGPI